MYCRRLFFANFCAMSAMSISWQNLNPPNLLVRSFYQIHVYFYGKIILHHLGFPLSQEYGFSEVKSSYIKRTTIMFEMMMVPIQMKYV